MGMSFAKQLFSRVINQEFPPLSDGVVVDVDEVWSYATNFETPFQWLESVFQRLRESRLNFTTEKWNFFCEEIVLLDHKIGQDRIPTFSVQGREYVKHTDSKDPKENYEFYRCNIILQVVKSYSTLAHPLTQLLRRTSLVTVDLIRKQNMKPHLTC